MTVLLQVCKLCRVVLNPQPSPGPNSACLVLMKEASYISSHLISLA